MIKKITRLSIILLLVFFQLSAVSPFFYPGPVPDIMLMLVVAWTMVVGFENIWMWIVGGALIFDLASFNPAGTSMILFIAVSYFISFVSRRFLVEHRGWGIAITFSFIILATSASLIIGGYPDGYGAETVWELVAYLQKVIIVNTLFFLVLFWVLKRVEEYLSYYDKKIALK